MFCHLELGVMGEGRAELPQTAEAHVRVSDQSRPVLVDIGRPWRDDGETTRRKPGGVARSRSVDSGVIVEAVACQARCGQNICTWNRKKRAFSGGCPFREQRRGAEERRGWGWGEAKRQEQVVTNERYGTARE